MKKIFTRNTSKKSAFTLVELAMVMLIIALLIVAVLGGAALIKNARLQALGYESKGQAVVVAAFYSRFDAYPGDFASAVGASNVCGNGDGGIAYLTGNGAAITQPSGTCVPSESSAAWAQLKDASIYDSKLTGSYGAAATGAQTAGTTYPRSKSGGGWVFDYDQIGDTVNHNFAVMVGGTAPAATIAATNVKVKSLTTLTASLQQKDAYSLDRKLDDGDPTAGLVRGADINGATSCVASNKYVIGGTDASVCLLYYNVDIGS